MSQHAIEKIVVGIPLFLDGNESQQTKKTEQFIHTLARRVAPIEVVSQEETLSSFEARNVLEEEADVTGQIDDIAAMLILERYLQKET